jgi:transcriptional regulator with XRE-family HTH domain
VYLSERLQALREVKKLSQGDVENRTGLLRCYVSRVENGHTVPSLETLEKFARAYEVPLYQIFYEGDKAPKPEVRSHRESNGDWASLGKGFRTFRKIRKAATSLNARDRKLILSFAELLSRRKRSSN